MEYFLSTSLHLSLSLPYSFTGSSSLSGPRSPLLSPPPSFHPPLSHSVDQLRKGKVLVWNLRITYRLRNRREQPHRVLAWKVRWCPKEQLIAVSLRSAPLFSVQWMTSNLKTDLAVRVAEWPVICWCLRVLLLKWDLEGNCSHSVAAKANCHCRCLMLRQSAQFIYF